MKKRYLTTTAGLFLLSAALLTGCGTSAGETAAESETSADALSAVNGLLGEFTSVTLDGEDVDQDIFAQSDLTMLNIWGTFCGPCIREMPDLGALSEEYQGKMQIVGIISDVSTANDATALEIIDYTGADYTHIVNSTSLMAGYLGTVQVVPTTIFLDREGNELKTVTGSKSKEDWMSLIDEMLESVSHE